MIGLDNYSGPAPALVAEDVERLIRAMNARPPHCGSISRGTQGIVDGFGISLGTLYRYWPGRVEWVVVAGSRLPFLVRPDMTPVLLESRGTPRGRISDKLR